MNRNHFQAFLWLRWRIRVNQWRRGGIANAVLLVILAVAAVLLAAGLFVTLFFVGFLALPEASPTVLLFVWDGLVVGFLSFWLMGLLTELQRSEALSLDKILHLPVSLTGAFLINYFSSLLSLSLIVFVPAAIGLCTGLVFGMGPAMLLLFPLVAALLLMVTALTYQFQSWLASLMANKRLRRTVIVLVTGALILLFQLPNLINLHRPWNGHAQDSSNSRFNQEKADLQRSLSAGEISLPQYQERLVEIQKKHQALVQEKNQQTWEKAEQTARLINLILPPGWLPLGAMGLAEGQVLPALGATLGLGLFGTLSLWRAYRTTLRLYTGQFTSGGRPTTAVVPRPAPKGHPVPHLLERELPGVSQQASAIALGGLRSFLRAPEGKMMLLGPIIMVVVIGSIFWMRLPDIPENLRPLQAFGAVVMILFSLVQLAGNQFGFDRNGFRVFVLCPAPRGEILLGKNLAFAPFALGLSVAVVIPLQVAYPMRLGFFLAVLPQMTTMYLLFCLLTNFLSILAPLRVSPGSLRPANIKLVPFLLQFSFFFLFPLAMSPALLPWGIQLVLEELEWVQGFPLALVLAVLECGVTVFLYRLAVTGQGRLLQAREQKILDLVTIKDE